MILLGEYKGSGLKEAPYLVRRRDGQFVHLSRLLYLIAQVADGQRSLGQIAERVSREFGRPLVADDVGFLVEKKLRPLGVLAAPEGESIEPLRLKQSLLGLRYRIGLMPAGVINFLIVPFLPLFWLPVVVTVVGALIAVDVWLLFYHGLLEGVRQLMYEPSLLLMFFAVEIVAMAWHEFGHATACRYGGAKPGVVGVGLYIIWFVFYSDVTDSYRLDKAGRLRTDLGGIYFDVIFTLAIAGAYFLTGFEPLLVIIVFNQLDSLDEFSPFLRLDGYYVLSDLTGVPDLYKSIRPTLKSLLGRGQSSDEYLETLKPWVRKVVTVWVLSVVPGLLVGLLVLVVYGPWFVVTGWDSFLAHYAELSSGFREGNTIEVIVGLINVGAFVLPVFGGALIVAWATWRWGGVAWRWSQQRPGPLARLALALAALGVLSLVAFIIQSIGV